MVSFTYSGKMQTLNLFGGWETLRLHLVLAAVKISVKSPFFALLAHCLLGEEARGQVGTAWPVPADLSTLDPVSLNKSMEGMGRGNFGEGPGSVWILCVCVCV